MKPKIYEKHTHNILISSIDPAAISIVRTLQEAGYKAYLVGGCVRDILLSTKPKDFDISTSATPEEIKQLFKRSCILIGKRFRLAHIRIKRETYELATFRKGDTSDTFITSDNIYGSELEDVFRRDFTMNGLFYDPLTETIIDYVNGYGDAQKKQLRSIGDPIHRFKQDPVRMIRGLKFKARFDIELDPEIMNAIIECKLELLKSAKPRILEEIFKMLESGEAYKFFHLLETYGVLSILIPSLALFIDIGNDQTIFSLLKAIDKKTKEQKKPLPRSVLVAAIVFPYFHNHVLNLYKDKKTKLHLGIIQEEAYCAIRKITTPHLPIPRKIAAKTIMILTSQYRFTPLEKKYRQLIKVPGIAEFNLPLMLFELRSQGNSDLTTKFNKWQQLFEKKQKQRLRKSYENLESK